MDSGADGYSRFLSGDENGLKEIIRLYRDGMIMYVNLYTQNISDAEDIAEDVFLKLVMKRPRYNGKASFKTWIYTIAGNTAKDYLRKKSKHQTASIEECCDTASDDEELEIICLKESRKIQLHRSMKRLSSDYQKILWLVYFENMSNKEAASVVRKSLHATENLLYKARKALKKQLEKDGFEYENL